MKTIAFSLFAVGMVLAASAHAGFNGQQNIQGNQGYGNAASAPHRPVAEKDRNGTLKALCASAFMQQYAVVCRK